VVSVFPRRGAGGSFDADAVRRRVVAALAPLGGRAELDPSTDYRALRRFRIGLSSAALLEAVDSIDWTAIDLSGGLLHVGFETVDGQFLPASFANGRAEETGIDVAGALVNDLQKYRTEPAGVAAARERGVMRRRAAQSSAAKDRANEKRSERRRRQKARELAAGTRAEKARAENRAREDRRRRKEARER
jgi:hypothetical protein